MSYEKVELAGGRAVLYRGDCLELLAAGLLKADAIVMDPPYGINYASMGSNGAGRKTQGAGKKWFVNNSPNIHGDDKPFSPVAFIETGAPVVTWGADNYRKVLPDGGCFLVWDKSLGFAPQDNYTDTEFAWTNTPKKIKRGVFRHLWKGVVTQGEDALKQGSPRYHVSQKPRELMRWCIELLRLRPDSLISDPYMGSGSTGIAALSLGHRFIGAEIDPNHFATACARIEKAAREMGLE